MKNYLNNKFIKIFNKENSIKYFSPGRVNLIGEHIDYNGGHVFPAAISIGTYAAVLKRDDNLVRIYSDGYSKNISKFNLNNFKKSYKHKWLNYIKGVFNIFKKEDIKIKNGFDLYIYSTLPSGSGLSSSASLESLIITILNDFNNLNLTKEKKALLGQMVENKYLGLNSGIMDQFSIIAGLKDHAILLDTDSLKYEYVPFNLKDYTLLIINSNKKRGLTDSKYNERFFETKKALDILKNHYEINNLCELKSSELNNIKNYLNNDLLFKRVRHVITEEERVIRSKEYLENDNIIGFSKLLNDSHYSLKNDYEVTGLELDTLQSLLIKYQATGARMTGAGFGGCLIAVVKNDDISNLKINVSKEYEKLIGYKPSFYESDLSDGTKMV
ncbi:MAG: galactokinase [Acholeplasmataceae bacterium]